MLISLVPYLYKLIINQGLSSCPQEHLFSSGLIGIPANGGPWVRFLLPYFYKAGPRKYILLVILISYF
nr:hypothetical protein Q903MT_gene2692 [Picea sitchensis]